MRGNPSHPYHVCQRRPKPRGLALRVQEGTHLKMIVAVVTWSKALLPFSKCSKVSRMTASSAATSSSVSLLNSWFRFLFWQHCMILLHEHDQILGEPVGQADRVHDAPERFIMPA